MGKVLLKCKKCNVKFEDSYEEFTKKSLKCPFCENFFSVNFESFKDWYKYYGNFVTVVFPVFLVLVWFFSVQYDFYLVSAITQFLMLSVVVLIAISMGFNIIKFIKNKLNKMYPEKREDGNIKNLND